MRSDSLSTILTTFYTTFVRYINIPFRSSTHDITLWSKFLLFLVFRWTGYGLHSLGIESRWGEKFSTPVQTGSGVHPASCTMGTGSFPGVNSGRGVTLTPHPLLVLLIMKE
jgi:hypothetical protein